IFFFQAEDGIRVFHVTGVQTCALPICPCAPPTRRGAPGRNPCCKPASTWSEYADPRGTPRLSPSKARGEGKRATRGALVPPAREIGRASCRERVELSVGEGAESRKTGV